MTELRALAEKLSEALRVLAAEAEEETSNRAAFLPSDAGVTLVTSRKTIALREAADAADRLAQALS